MTQPQSFFSSSASKEPPPKQWSPLSTFSIKSYSPDPDDIKKSVLNGDFNRLIDTLIQHRLNGDTLAYKQLLSTIKDPSLDHFWEGYLSEPQSLLSTYPEGFTYKTDELNPNALTIEAKHHHPFEILAGDYCYHNVCALKSTKTPNENTDAHRRKRRAYRKLGIKFGNYFCMQDRILSTRQSISDAVRSKTLLHSNFIKMIRDEAKESVKEHPVLGNLYNGITSELLGSYYEHMAPHITGAKKRAIRYYCHSLTKIRLSQKLMPYFKDSTDNALYGRDISTCALLTKLDENNKPEHMTHQVQCSNIISKLKSLGATSKQINQAEEDAQSGFDNLARSTAHMLGH